MILASTFSRTSVSGRLNSVLVDMLYRDRHL